MRRAAWVLALLALGAAGCARCGGARQGEVASVERVLPKGAAVVVVAPSLERLGQRLKLLEQLKVAAFLAPTQGFADARAFADALVGELGVDVRSPQALEQAGLDGARGAGAAGLVTGQAYLALPLKDAARFHAALSALAARRLGAVAALDRKVDGVALRAFAANAQAPARVGYVVAHGYALLATDEAVERLPALAVLALADSLATEAQLPARLGVLGAGTDAFAWVPTGSPLLAQLPFTSALVAASLGQSALEVGFDAPLKAEARARFAMLEAQPRAVEDLAGLLPRDAFLVARFDGDPSKLGPVAGELLGQNLARAFAQGGLDLEGAVLTQVKPGVVVSLSLAERPPLGQGLPQLDIRRTNPFTFAHLSGVAVARAPSEVPPLLDKVAALAPRFGAEMKRFERDGVPAWLTTWSQGEGVHFALAGERVFFGSPVQRLQALVKAPAGASPLAGAAGDALSVVVDLRRLAQSVRALPESAWGLGGFAMKGTTVRWLDATDDLVAVVGGLGLRDGAVQGRVALKLSMAAKAP
jgi:hypothetical protein